MFRNIVQHDASFGITSQFDSVESDVSNINRLVSNFQNSPGHITDKDQTTLDKIQTASADLADELDRKDADRIVSSAVKLNDLVATLQRSPGSLTSKDQKILDQLQTATKDLVTKVKAIKHEHHRPTKVVPAEVVVTHTDVTTPDHLVIVPDPNFVATEDQEEKDRIVAANRAEAARIRSLSRGAADGTPRDQAIHDQMVFDKRAPYPHNRCHKVMSAEDQAIYDALTPAEKIEYDEKHCHAHGLSVHRVNHHHHEPVTGEPLLVDTDTSGHHVKTSRPRMNFMVRR